MMRLIVSAVTCLTLSAISAQAGIPQDREETCPIGGEVFTVTSTASCSTFGREMTMRPQTSCEFITRLPVCPSNGLPMFKRFNREERDFLEALLASPAWESLRELPPWQRAYALAERLEETGTEESFIVVLNAYWHERTSFLDDADMVATFERETIGAIARNPEQAGILHAITAYMLGLAGEPDAAQSRLEQARRRASDEPFVQSYISQIANCLNDLDQPQCRPDARFAPDQ